MKNEKNVYPMFFGGVSNDKNNALKSSSGGVFGEICKSILAEKGVLYGAVQIEPLKICHQRIDSYEALDLLRKSKYIRSDITGIYARVREDLELGRPVLFSGVGCQISGLYSFLGEKFDNLITCEVVCHGLPLKESWKKYVAEQEASLNSKLIKLDFRDKREGWSNNCITEKYSDNREIVNLSECHMVHELYLKGINMEPGCGHCKYQSIPRIADITLADFWKCQGVLFKYADIGISLIAVNSEKGMLLLHKIESQLELESVTAQEAKNSCKHMFAAPFEHPSRKAFAKLIQKLKMSELYSLFSQCGEVVLPEKLAIYKDEEAEQLQELFAKDTQEVAYFTDKNDVLVGIATFGDFCRKYALKDSWINRNSRKVLFRSGYLNELQHIFASNSKINRIPVIDEAGKIIFEVRRNCNANGLNDPRKIALAFSELKRRNNMFFCVHRPDIMPGYRYSLRQQVRMKKKLTFSQMLAEPRKYLKEYADLFGSQYSEEEVVQYVERLGEIPPIIELDGRYIHADADSGIISVVNGRRVTTDQPTSYIGNIHIYGRCGVFGYAVENHETMPSFLQKLLNERGLKFRVVNHGLWGADEGKIVNNMLRDLYEGQIKPNDIVICYMMLSPEIREELLNLSVKFVDTTETFHHGLTEECNFFDRPGHMTASGYKLIANVLVEELISDGFLKISSENAVVSKISNPPKHKFRHEITGINTYIEKIWNCLPEGFLAYGEVVGAIVMNCNPFTKGHEYLINQASKLVDKLLIFVVEEDKSVFPFDLRFKMVCKGTEHIDNVCVLPSGNFMISTLTFPEYFTKEKQQNVSISPTYDVRLFAEYIAPAFHITKRFVGTEPSDNVTNQYNETMKEILPEYGVQLIEIERLKKNGKYVTATTVRKYLNEKEYQKLKELLPEETITCLMEAEMWR